MNSTEPCNAIDLDAMGVGLAEAMPSPVLVTDESGGLALCNANFRFLFGCEERAQPGTPIEDLVDSPHRELFLEALLATKMRRCATESRLPTFSGECEGLVFTLTTTTVDDGGQRRVIFLLREVSAGLQLSQLRESTEVKNFLFRTMMHDMKTPLAAVINATELLPALLSETSLADCDELIGAIDSSASRMKQLLDDTHDYFTLRFPMKAEFTEAIDLEKLIDPLIKVYQMQGYPHQFELQSHGPTTILGERHRLTRALDNLLSNAVKYSPDGGRVVVTIDGQSHSSWVRLAISDEGPGIPEEYLDKIWDPFYRLRGTAAEGTGLGLSITRHIIEGQEGCIDVTSELGSGTTFVIALNAAPRGQ